MKYTLLDLTQNILSSMDGDEINSIADTTESRQVVEVIKTTYFNLVANGELPRDNDLFQLVASGDATKPVTMSLPDDAQAVFWVKYDYQTTDSPYPSFQEIQAMPFADFVIMVTNLDATDTAVTSYSYNNGAANWTLYCRNDVAPRFYTTANDGTILFDAYDNTVDSTLQSSKTMVYGQLAMPWTESNTFVLPLDDKQFQRLLNEAKSLAYAEIKQTAHAKAEKTARDLKIDQQVSKTKASLMGDYDKVFIQGRVNYGQLKPTGRYK